MSILAPSPTSVYSYYDRNGVLLYVGITGRGSSRQWEHNRDKEWWAFVHRQTVRHFPTRTEALSAEKARILKYRPPFNKQHNPDHEAMRAIYFAQGHVVAQLKPREIQVSRKARQLLSVTDHRLPLRAVSASPEETVYTTDRKLMALAETLSWRPGVLFRTAGQRGVLASIEEADNRRLFRFTTKSGGSLPANAVLKLRATKDPYSIYIYEAVAA